MLCYLAKRLIHPNAEKLPFQPNDQLKCEHPDHIFGHEANKLPNKQEEEKDSPTRRTLARKTPTAYEETECRQKVKQGHI